MDEKFLAMKFVMEVIAVFDLEMKGDKVYPKIVSGAVYKSSLKESFIPIFDIDIDTEILDQTFDKFLFTAYKSYFEKKYKDGWSLSEFNPAFALLGTAFDEF